MKLLNNEENPIQNSQWPLLLPTVVESVNKSIIQSLNVTRETLHYNVQSTTLPLTEISSEDNEQLNKAISNCSQNFFQTVLTTRQKHLKTNKKTRVPLFHDNQIVFVRNMAPTSSTILKIPNKGPYRIEKIKERNVTLIELETGKTFHSHVEHIRPLSLKEFKLLLNNKWDLTTNLQKSTKISDNNKIFDHPDSTFTLSESLFFEQEPPPEIEDEIDLENLSYPPQPIKESPQLAPEPKPPDINSLETGNLDSRHSDQSNCSEFNDPCVKMDSENGISEMNTLHVEKDLSQLYRIKLQSNDKHVKFLLNTQ